MPFQKGVSGNSAGRPKGKSDQSEQAIREFLKNQSEEYFYGTGANSFAADLILCSPSKRLELMERYLKYAISPLAALKIETDVNVNQTGTIKIDFGFGDNKELNQEMKNIIDLI